MERLQFDFDTTNASPGARRQAIVGVVASGNLEILLERVAQANVCLVTIATPAHGYEALWRAVVNDFVQQRATGGLRISINDSGARPDIVSLRLAQGARLMEE